MRRSAVAGALELITLHAPHDGEQRYCSTCEIITELEASLRRERL